MKVYYYVSSSNELPAGWTFVVLWAEADWNKTLIYPGNNTPELGKLKIQIVNKTGANILTQTMLLTQNDIQNNLSSTSTDKVLSAAQGKVLKDLVDSLAVRGTGAPTTATVGQVGTLYEDTTNGDLYICTDATNPYVWEAVGGGGSITPTTDSSAPTSATAGRLGEIRIDTTTNTAYMCVLSDSTTPAYEWKQITA